MCPILVAVVEAIHEPKNSTRKRNRRKKSHRYDVDAKSKATTVTAMRRVKNVVARRRNPNRRRRKKTKDSHRNRTAESFPRRQYQPVNRTVTTINSKLPAMTKVTMVVRPNRNVLFPMTSLVPVRTDHVARAARNHVAVRSLAHVRDHVQDQSPVRVHDHVQDPSLAHDPGRAHGPNPVRVRSHDRDRSPAQEVQDHAPRRKVIRNKLLLWLSPVFDLIFSVSQHYSIVRSMYNFYLT